MKTPTLSAGVPFGVYRRTSRCCLFLLAAVEALAFGPPADAATAHSAYVTNLNGHDVSAYSIAADGSLSAVTGSPFAAGNVRDLAVTPDGAYVYVANAGDNTISAFSIAADGSLSAISGSPFAATGPRGIAVTPDGAHLYATNSPGAISAFSIAADGSLSAVSGSPFASGAGPAAVVVTPDGTHLYVTDLGANDVYAYSIAADGSLSAVGSPLGTGGLSPISAAVTPDGAHLYVVNHDSNNVSAFSIAADGSLSAVSGSPFGAGNFPFVDAVSPDGAHLYVTNEGSGDISAYSIAADGSLSAITGSPFGAGNNPRGVMVTPDGAHLYAANFGGNNVSAYSIAADGSLSAVTGSPFAGGSSPFALAVRPDQGPVAAFSATTATIGQTTNFDASASSDSDGAVTSYHWDFGDGSTQTTTSPTTTHTYATAGNYSTTLTVTDDAGCSMTKTFTGQTMSCNGSSAARISHQITVSKFFPAVSTNASAGVSLGGQIDDTATLSGGTTPGGTIAFKLYGPGDSSCSDTPVFTDQRSVSGDGAYQSADFIPTQAGVYRWTADYSGDATNDSVSSPCNAANESVSVSATAPLLTTSASAGVILGGQVHDTATLSGGQSPTGQITFNLYDRDDTDCSGTPIFTDQQAASDNGDYQSGDFTPTGIGTYRWTASYSGDANNNAASTACNEGSESVTVTAPTIDAASFRLDPSTFAATNKPTPLGPPLPKDYGVPKGSQIELTLDAPTLVHLFVRRKGAPPPTHHRKRHGFNRDLQAGPNSIPFTGNLYGRKLRPGKYHLYARPVSSTSGRRFKRLSTPFTIVGG